MLASRSFLVQEYGDRLRPSNAFQILDPVAKTLLGMAVEEHDLPQILQKLSADRRRFRSNVVVYQGSDPQDKNHRLFSMEHDWNIGIRRPEVRVFDSNNRLLGRIKHKLLAFASFWVEGPDGEQIASIRGNVTGKQFSLLNRSDQELGQIEKQWIPRQDTITVAPGNFQLQLKEDLGPSQTLLLLAASLAIDFVNHKRE